MLVSARRLTYLWPGPIAAYLHVLAIFIPLFVASTTSESQGIHHVWLSAMTSAAAVLNKPTHCLLSFE